MIKRISMALLVVVLSATVSHAAPFVSAASQLGVKSVDAHFQLTAGNKYKRPQIRTQRKRTQNLAVQGGVVKDTCPGGDTACIKELKANCDKAGGGLSTEPDGGVDCFVVGIHDQ